VKRIFAAAIGLLVPLLVAPGLALAQDGSGLGPPEGPEVGGVGGSLGGSVGGVGGGTAFTGAEIAGLVAFAVALLVIGVVALTLARRRRSARLEA
jgi:hypothetical protein